MVRCLTKHTPYHGEFGNMVCQILTIAPYMPEGGWWRNTLISTLGLYTEYVKILIFLHTCNTPCSTHAISIHQIKHKSFMLKLI